MKKINILTKGFDSPNGCAFLFPLVKHRQALADHGIKLNFYEYINDLLYECDTLIVESKYFSSDWSLNTAGVLGKFSKFREKIAKIIYFDISDSTGFPHARVLPYVDGYVKNQLLKDKRLYLKSMYAHRLYADYYHRHYDVNDKEILYSEAIGDPNLLNKLKVGWNSGLADYSLYGPYYMMCYKKFPIRRLLSYPARFTKPTVKRINDLSCRMGTYYDRDSISWQRCQIQKKLQSFILTNKLSRWGYYRELRTSKLVISPFGLGEITLKDFEVFLTGALLIKPDMSHMQTWPNLFQDNKTMLSFNWNLNNIQQRIEESISNYKELIDVAQYGQSRYREYLCGSEASQLFCDHFMKVIESC